jgi:hypothetical protein
MVLGDNYSLCKPNVTAFNPKPFSRAIYALATFECKSSLKYELLPDLT